MFEFNDVIRACAEVHQLGRIAGLRFKALPIIQWEFADKSEFFNADAALQRALSTVLTHKDGRGDRREMLPQGVVEFDCHGVTFRLICKAIAADVARIQAQSSR